MLQGQRRFRAGERSFTPLSSSLEFAGGTFSFSFFPLLLSFSLSFFCRRNKQDPASSDKTGSYDFKDFKRGLEALRLVE